MRFANPRCPNCQQLASGTLELLEAYARVQWVASEEPVQRAEYEGTTEVFWDGQRTQREGNALLLWCDDCCVHWPAVDLDAVPSEPVPAPEPAEPKPLPKPPKRTRRIELSPRRKKKACPEA